MTRKATIMQNINLYRAQIKNPNTPSVTCWIAAGSEDDARAEVEFTLTDVSSTYEIEDGAKIIGGDVEISERELEASVICTPHSSPRRFQGKTVRESLNILAI